VSSSTVQSRLRYGCQGGHVAAAAVVRHSWLHRGTPVRQVTRYLQ
jgi:hypothetical protein